jgi:hypothetical protein
VVPIFDRFISSPFVALVPGLRSDGWRAPIFFIPTDRRYLNTSSREITSREKNNNRFRYNDGARQISCISTCEDREATGKGGSWPFMACSSPARQVLAGTTADTTTKDGQHHDVDFLVRHCHSLAAWSNRRPIPESILSPRTPDDKEVQMSYIDVFWCEPALEGLAASSSCCNRRSILVPQMPMSCIMSMD